MSIGLLVTQIKYNIKSYIKFSMVIGGGGASLVGHMPMGCQDLLDTVFNKGQDVSLSESIHQTSNCFKCYPSNQ